MAAPRADRRGPAPSAQCSLCGIALPADLMVPDGGQACADIRWYCQDTKACTERWTASPPRHAPIAPGSPGTVGRTAAPDPAPADLLGSPVEEAWSIDRG